MLILSPALFNRVIKTTSQTVSWSQASFCPCRDPYSGAASPTCGICTGRGINWAPASVAWCVPAGMKIQRQWEQMGEFEMGDLVMTMPSDSPIYDAGEYDRVLLDQSTEPFRAVLTYTGSETLGFPVSVVESVYWLIENNTVQVDGGIPVVSDSGAVSWASPVAGPAPPTGVQYSIVGRRVPEFFLFKDITGDRAHFGGLTLPRKVVLRKFDLLGK